MSEKKTDDKNVIFELERNYPDSKSIFGTRRKPIQDILNTCDIVLDTNVLLLPYEAESEGFGRIVKFYTQVQDRLCIPERVVREFARKRPVILGQMLNELSTHRSNASMPGALKIPIVSEDLNLLKPLHDEAKKAIKAYRDAFDKLKAKVDDWEHNDPVMVAYRKIFTTVDILGLSMTEDEILAQLESRYARKMPPGYADRRKDDKGVGDLVIWLSVLERARNAKNDMLFVTADSKKDWQHQVDNTGFMPRIELVNEYASVSEGRCIYMMPLSDLLRLNDVEADDIEDIEEISLHTWSSILSGVSDLVYRKPAKVVAADLFRQHRFRSIIDESKEDLFFKIETAIVVDGENDKAIDLFVDWCFENRKHLKVLYAIESEGIYEFFQDIGLLSLPFSSDDIKSIYKKLKLHGFDQA